MKKIALLLLLTATAFAQTQKDTEYAVISTSGASATFVDAKGSGTLTLSYSIVGSPSAMSIVAKGCQQDGTCSTLNTSTATSSNLVTFTGGYDHYVITATWTGTSGVTVYKTGIQAKLSTGSGSVGTAGQVQMSDGSGKFAAAHITDNGSFLAVTEPFRMTTGGGADLLYDTQLNAGGSVIHNDFDHITFCSGCTYGTFNAPLLQNFASLGKITTIAAAATIAPNAAVVHITGTAAIVTITPPSTYSTTQGGCMTLWPDAAFAWTNAGNIVTTAGTAVVNVTKRACWGGTSWTLQ